MAEILSSNGKCATDISEWFPEHATVLSHEGHVPEPLSMNQSVCRGLQSPPWAGAG